MTELTKIDEQQWALAGDLGFSSVDALLPAFKPSTHSRLDLQAVQRSDSAGLALLVEWAERARDVGASLSLINVDADLRHLITFCKVESLFDEIHTA
ncbi:STAS domain-containing protein [Gammaproteobacteria bacterium]|nr:STAS domain-containing protein [Gammaproteobacteria bacterium]